MARRLLAILLMTLVAAAVCLFAPATALAQSCDEAREAIERPDASFFYSDESVEVQVVFDLDANNLRSVETTRDRLASEAELSAEASAATNDYLDDLAIWFARSACDDPIVEDRLPSIDGADPITNVPVMPDTPFGFGGGDIVAVPPVVVQITSPQGVTTDIARTVEPIADGDALAVSGSESIVLVYFGAGMVAFGATAVGMHRWMRGPVD